MLLGWQAAIPVKATEAPLPTVEKVDLSRYVGTWHEVARMPNRFQDQCVGEVTATYRLRPDGMIDVLNRCRLADGSYDEAQGLARVVGPATHAKLEVSFFSLFGWRPFWGDYWIIALDPDYRYAVVAEPGRRYAWILARDSALDEVLQPEMRQRLREVLHRAGYEPDDLIWDTAGPPASGA
ncbi:MAG: hypothetical protein D6720_00955 [Gammaproteobacteria bacterium]|nr:MAG: hypothetical protein D6720_00955 [Gammaproteobacteria bacterium]